MAYKKSVAKTVYQIKLQGELGGDWSDWFDGLSVSVEGDLAITTLTGIIADQAALRGVLNKIWDLNLTLISVMRLEDMEVKNGP